MIEVKRELVEAAKMALKTAMNRNVIVSDTTVQSIQYLAGLYESTGDDDYLLSAYAMIQAYVELGYRYERCQKEFDQILKKCKTSYEIEFGGMYFSAGEVRLTKPQIRLLLGRWSNPRRGDMKIDEVLEDILLRVKNKEYGRHIYRNGNPEKGGRTYELIIDEKVSYLYDKNKDKYYLLIQEEKGAKDDGNTNCSG